MESYVAYYENDFKESEHGIHWNEIEEISEKILENKGRDAIFSDQEIYLDKFSRLGMQSADFSEISDAE